MPPWSTTARPFPATSAPRVGAGAFTGTAGELRAEQIDGNTFVQGDTNGDGIADFVIRVDGLQALTGSDFIL